MKKNVVIFDIDGVLADFEGALVDYLEKIFGKDIARKNRDVLSIEERFAGESDVIGNALRFVNDPNSYYAIKAYPGMADFLYGLEEVGYLVAYVTARHPSCREVTSRWLRKNFFPLSDGRLILGAKDKASILDNNYVAFAVDDSPVQVKNLVAAGIPTLCMERDWNEDVFPRLFLSKMFGEPALPTVWENVYTEPIRFFQWIEKMEIEHE